MRVSRRLTLATVGLVAPFLYAAAATATPIAGELFYTTFGGGTNLHEVDYTYDGASTFTLSGNSGIAALQGADGISGNPNDPNSLLVGGQGNRIHRVSKSGTVLQTLTTPTNVYHLEAASSSVLYGTDIPSVGSFTRATMNPDGSMSAATTMSIVLATGGAGSITQIITTPSDDFYTASGPAGFGAFGTVSIAGTVATLTPIVATGLPAAHGGVYDPFSGNIILFGDGRITQLDLTGAIIAEVAGAGNFDQGTVDGLGHVYAASNNGELTFIDYATSGLIDSGFLSTQFLAATLDDIAPLVGAGSTTTNDVPEPATLVLFAFGLAGLGAARWRRKRN